MYIYIYIYVYTYIYTHIINTNKLRKQDADALAAVAAVLEGWLCNWLLRQGGLIIMSLLLSSQ